MEGYQVSVHFPLNISPHQTLFPITYREISVHHQIEIRDLLGTAKILNVLHSRFF